MAKGNTTPLNSGLSLDTTDFKTGIAAANRELRVLESGFKAATATMGDWSKTSDGLQTRIDALSKEIDVQTRKVSAVTDEYKRVAAEQGETSKAAQDLEIKLNKETETLGKMQAELSSSEKSLAELGDESKTAAGKVDGLGKDLTKAGDEADKTEKKSDGLKKTLDGLGTVAAGAGKALMALGTAAMGAVTGLAAMVVKSSDAAGELVDLSAQTGLSTTQIQELDYAATLMGVDVGTITNSMAKFTNVIEGADSGVGPMADDMATLGVSVRDSNGVLRDSNEVYFEALNALGQLENETQKEIIAQNLFGKSYQELTPLINTSAEEMAAMKEEAHQMGAVMDEEAVSGLESFGDELDKLKMGLKGNIGMISSAMLPVFSELTGTAQGWMKEFAGILSGSGGDLSSVGPQIGELLGKIFGDITEKLPDMVNLGLGIIGGLIDAMIANLPILIPAVLQIIQSLIQFLGEYAPKLATAAIPMIQQLVIGLIGMLPELIQVGLDIVIAIVQGLAQALPNLITAVIEIIPLIITTLLDNLPLLVTAAIELIMAVVTGLTEGIPLLISYVPNIMLAIVDALIKSLPELLIAAVEIIMALIQGLIGAIPTLVAFIPEIILAIVGALITSLPQIIEAGIKIIIALVTGITENIWQIAKLPVDIIKALVDAFGDIGGQIWDIGKDIVMGIWDGIESAWEDLKDWFGGLLGGLLGGAQDEIDAHSPSRLWAKRIGKPMAEGIGVGFASAIPELERDLSVMINGLTNSMMPSPNLAYAGAANGALPGAAITMNNYVRNDLDLELLALKVAKKLRR